MFNGDFGRVFAGSKASVSFGLRGGVFRGFAFPVFSGVGPFKFEISDTAFVNGLCRAVVLSSESVYDGKTFASRQVASYSATHYVFSRCTFLGRTESEDGGGIRVTAMTSDPARMPQVTFRECTFRGCSAKNGAGISSSGVKSVTVTNSLFHECGAVGYGGGFRCSSDQSFTGTGLNCTQCTAKYMCCAAMAHTVQPIKLMYIIVDRCVGDGAISIGYSSGLIDHVTVMSPTVGQGNEAMIYVEQLTGDTDIDTLCLYDMPVDLSKGFYAVAVIGGAFDAKLTVRNVNLPPEAVNGEPVDMFSFGAQINYDLMSYQFQPVYECYESDYIYFEGSRHFTPTTEVADSDLVESWSSEHLTSDDILETITVVTDTTSSTTVNHSDKGLGSGEIIGIVFCVLVVILVIIVLIICLRGKKRRWAFEPSELESEVDNTDVRLFIIGNNQGDILNKDQLAIV